MRSVLGRDIPVFYLSYGGWLSGFARSIDDDNLDLRMAQHAVAGILRDPLSSRAFVLGKVKNQRTMIRRSARDGGSCASASIGAHTPSRRACAQRRGTSRA
jgi:hypothetical protein